MSTCTNSDDFCNHNPSLLDKRLLLNLYSRERLMSGVAKSRFVEPDLQQLPDISA
jgi:hypothetical protein